MKNEQISVWAPSKIVLDAVDGPSSGPDDPVALTTWFADYIEASDLTLIGVAPSGEAQVPVLIQDIEVAGL